MKHLSPLLILAVLVGACGKPGRSSESTAPASSPTRPPEAYGTLAQVMRGIPFPNSNIIFDTQTKDPRRRRRYRQEQHRGGRRGNRGVFQRLSRMAAGGKQRNRGAETANLILIPGRKCENGLPVPLEQEVYRKATRPRGRRTRGLQGRAVQEPRGHGGAERDDFGRMRRVPREVPRRAARQDAMRACPMMRCPVVRVRMFW